MIPEFYEIPDIHSRRGFSTAQCEFCDAEERARKVEIFGYVVAACRACKERLTEKVRRAHQDAKRRRERDERQGSKRAYEPEEFQRPIALSNVNSDCVSVIRRNITVDGGAYRRSGKDGE